MNDANEMILAPDSFLGTLGLADLERRMRHRQERDLLFRLTIEYIKDRALTGSSPKVNAELNELPLKVPGTSVVVRLGDPDKDELKLLLSLALYVAGKGSIDLISVTIVGLIALKRRIDKLYKEYGERSIFDVLGELDRPTVRNVTLALYGKPCRYPRVGCRFHSKSGDECAISKDDVEKTVESLMERNILRKRNSVAPYEYSATL